MEKLTIQKRIGLLTEFLSLVERLRSNNGSSSDFTTLTSEINRRHVAVRHAVDDAGVPTMVTQFGTQFDVLQNVFDLERENLGFTRDAVERALGFYQHLLDSPDLVSTPNTPGPLDVVGGIERALRPAFTEPPANEKEVQDAIEVILKAVGVKAHREKERAAVGPTTFIPDFTLPALDLALEVKLANEKHGESAVQHEIAEDVAGFRTRWRLLLVVVYDCGVIRDPYRMQSANAEEFGVRVVIVKH